MTEFPKHAPHPTRANTFRFSIDRGGTFTDVYAEIPGGGFRAVKLLSEDPLNYEDAPREGIRRIISEVSGKSVPPGQIDETDIDWIRMGTTVATNALLERKGERHVLVTTKGLGDILKIGDQARPDIFDLVIEKPEQVYEAVIEVDERVRPLKETDTPSAVTMVSTKTGDRFVVLAQPDRLSVRTRLESAYQKGFRAIAVVFAHAYSFPDHELLVGDIAREIGFTQISLSHQVAPMVKIVPRGDTTTVDAYLTPHIRAYLNSFRRGFKGNLNRTSLMFMRSDGGLVSAGSFKGSNAILSGPAGGVVGYAMTTGKAQARKPVIGFDMGGTSTDVSRFGGEYELSHESKTAGVRVRAPQLNIVTVAAGGGSRLFFRHGLFEVGPESAGAHPGPVCYRKNGYVTLTDANLFLGRLQPDYFPWIFGTTEDLPLDKDATINAITQLTDEINQSVAREGGGRYTAEEVALGFIQVANETMIRPIREISVMKGYDIEEHVLACFGGAGGQHACSIARELGIKKIFIHKQAGILSAFGLGLADVVAEKQEPSAVVLGSPRKDEIENRLDVLERSARQQLTDQGFPGEEAEAIRYLNLRYKGTDTAIMIARPLSESFEAAFRKTHIREFGFDLIDRPIVVDDLRVRAVYHAPGYQTSSETTPLEAGVSEESVRCYFVDGWRDTPVYKMEKLGSGQQIQGPAIIIQDTSTILIEPACSGSVTAAGDLEIDVAGRPAESIEGQVDPVRLSIFSHLFMSIAEQMGRTLQKTAISTNIKERLDFSCALFNDAGDLVANAPHVPVHLGSMGDTVRWQIKHHMSDLKEGDVIATNHPCAGGSHLPDITVISPVWRNGKPVLFVASRGHHADIGGISPGSMPPFSTVLAEEGACFKSFKLVRDGRFNEKGLIKLLKSPGELASDKRIKGSRRISDNISDLKAQVAANQQGIDLLYQMMERYSLPVVQAYMGHIQQNAETAIRDMLRHVVSQNSNSTPSPITAEDYLDDGSIIKLALTIHPKNGSAVFDFSGTSDQLPGNLNTPGAVVKSAVIYALRCILNQNIPLNQGCLNPIEIITEKGSLLSPSDTAAVVGGNVLTSQRITDVIFKAFQTVAASQGCMNNLTFGNDRFGYYETIGGGAGAGPRWHGQSGVHSHMTNTRITDPEILERRYPVLVHQFSLRAGSGGLGKFNGGDGLIRELEFLERLNVALLTERRVFHPYGLKGGAPGAKGENLLVRLNGDRIDLGGKNEVTVSAGDRVVIKTPGGGGYGEPV